MSDYSIKGMQGGMAELPTGYDYTESIKGTNRKERKNRHKHAAYYRQISPQIEQQVDDANAMIQDLNDQIDNCKDPEKLRKLSGARDELKQALETMLHEPPGGSNSFGDFKSAWQDLRNAVGDALLNAQVAKLGGDPGISDDVKVAKPQGEAVDMSGGTETRRAKMNAKSVDTSGSADSTGKTGESEATGKIGDMTPDEMINKITDDPEAVSEYIQSLDPMDQQIAMASMQERMNEINQMFSMMTNIAKAQHDTAKAAINNMRV